jgi:hypothetical protein
VRGTSSSKASAYDRVGRGNDPVLNGARARGGRAARGARREWLVLERTDPVEAGGLVPPFVYR